MAEQDQSRYCLVSPSAESAKQTLSTWLSKNTSSIVSGQTNDCIRDHTCRQLCLVPLNSMLDSKRKYKRNGELRIISSPFEQQVSKRNLFTDNWRQQLPAHDRSNNRGRHLGCLGDKYELSSLVSEISGHSSSNNRLNDIKGWYKGIRRSEVISMPLLIGLALIVCLMSSPLISFAHQSVDNNRQNGDVDIYHYDARARLEPQKAAFLRADPFGDQLKSNASSVFDTLLKKRPYTKYWKVEQKWDDLFRRALSIQENVKKLMLKNLIRDAEYYADLGISKGCQDDLRFIQIYSRTSKNFRWLLHMLDSTGKSEPGMLTGNLAQLGHVIQCIKVRAPARPTNNSFDERYFDHQTQVLGERFRGKYCLASVRPVMPAKPYFVSRFSSLLNESLLSNVSYMGEPIELLKRRSRQLSVPEETASKIDRKALRLDQIPFESEMYSYLIAQRNFMYTLPRYLGVCYPSSCSREDIQMVLQKTMDDQHQVVDMEFECEQEQASLWDWLITPRLVCYVILSIILTIVVFASLARYVLLSKLNIKRSKLEENSPLAALLDTLDMLSMDKCAGILFVKTRQASPFVDWTEVENNRSTSIDALRGFLIIMLVYSQLVMLGCLPIPFMWAKWADAMFPLYRSPMTQVYANMFIWTEAFYMISAYLIGIKLMENLRPRRQTNSHELHLYKQTVLQSPPIPVINFFTFALRRYVRLVTPMLAFILLNYVWPQLSNGFVMQDQANKIMQPCDSFGWTNLMLFHNQHTLNETCLWPSHVSASFFQLHLLSYPLIMLCLLCLHGQYNQRNPSEEDRGCRNINKITSSCEQKQRKLLMRLMRMSFYGLVCSLALVGAIYPALKASQHELIVPFLIDYIDFDNYQRVLEWMVIPTYNHLTAYMFGLLLAFLASQRQSRRETSPYSLNDSWFYNSGAGGAVATNANIGEGSFTNRDSSLESVRSSSTQELQSPDAGVSTTNPINRPYLKSTYSPHQGQFMSEQYRTKFTLSSCPSSSADQGSNLADDSSSRSGDHNWIWESTKSLLAAMTILIVLMSSWFWNGLGQPMSKEQTFWYLMVTKLAFCIAFAYLFYKYFAFRRNSNNPWMITRFLVPIGRMSLTMFYTSWLVIWFDLLSSLYQWHPSHYFIVEKFCEIIFMTSVLSLFNYGIFEGIIKRFQYKSRRDRVEHDRKHLASMSLVSIGQVQLDQSRHRQQVKNFESFFHPIERKWLDDEQQKADGQRVEIDDHKALKSDAIRVVDKEKQSSFFNSGGVVTGDLQSSEAQTRTTTTRIDLPLAQSKVDKDLMKSNLSPVDHYKLNAELRANYSFASIGLYDAAGSTGELNQPQVSQS